MLMVNSVFNQPFVGTTITTLQGGVLNSKRIGL